MRNCRKRGCRGREINVNSKKSPKPPVWIYHETKVLHVCTLKTVSQTMNSGKGEEGAGVVQRIGEWGACGGDSQSLARSFRWQYGAAIPADRFQCMLCSVTEQKQGSGTSSLRKPISNEYIYICSQLSLSYSTSRLHTVSCKNNHKCLWVYVLL